MDSNLSCHVQSRMVIKAVPVKKPIRNVLDFGRDYFRFDGTKSHINLT
ncbi:hypothetical protein SAMN04488519_104196 [Algoriphagus ornithinivorans]|uniref:Uncharacterized protein n=1 Tax=Algoriphagus ornithinivorans TaxID=226506 RepID=A0A1I5F3J8_9BACT|nr:hypothetical protein [Algoriphagus ornithinivorans]SFO18206.1 hypothetical protein SAMN04488519_104196 [Algoriphagus ornithinivorans]